MISDDLVHMSDRLAGYALHRTAPPPTELGIIADGLLKFARVVRRMEELPLNPQDLRVRAHDFGVPYKDTKP